MSTKLTNFINDLKNNLNKINYLYSGIFLIEKDKECTIEQGSYYKSCSNLIEGTYTTTNECNGVIYHFTNLTYFLEIVDCFGKIECINLYIADELTELQENLLITEIYCYIDIDDEDFDNMLAEKYNIVLD